MSARIIPFEYQGQPVRFNDEGWLHATEIAARFGKEPAQWLRLPDTLRYLEGLQRRYGKTTYVKTSRARKDRGGGTWLHPKLAVKFARWLDVDFEIWCDEQIDALLRSGDARPWANARREAAIGYRSLCDAVKLNCEARGKTPERHHFINEARLIGEVVTGTFAGRDREQLSTGELELVTLAEIRNATLIAAGMPYAERKASLLCYLQELQGKRLARGLAA
ncbi:KilA-N domain-containing protein [Azotobacter sp. CWF10]